MDYSKVLNEKFNQTKIFYGVCCGDQWVQKVDGSVFSKWCDNVEDSIFCAYKLLNCCSMKGEPVAAGFFIARKVIIGFGYEVAGKFNVTLVKRPLYSDDLDRVLGDLVKMMERDETIGSKTVVKLGTMKAKDAVLKSVDCLLCKETRNKVFKIDGIVINFGFDTMPMTMLLGCANGVFAACLASAAVCIGNDAMSTIYTPGYETIFESGKAGNDFFVNVKRRAESAKDGGVLYRLDGGEFFDLFYKVDGVSLCLGEVLCG